MTPMGRIVTDLWSIFCGPAIAEETSFVRVYQSNPCHPCAIFKDRVVTFYGNAWLKNRKGIN